MMILINDNTQQYIGHRISLKYLLGAFIGSAYAALPVALSRVLVRNLAGIFGWVGSLISLQEQTLTQGTQILAPLKTAVIVSPWLLFLLAGAVLGALAAWFFDRRPVKHTLRVLKQCLASIHQETITLFITVAEKW